MASACGVAGHEWGLPCSGGHRPLERSRELGEGATCPATPCGESACRASGRRRGSETGSQAARVAGFDLAPLHLFPMPNVEDVEGAVLEQDVVWVMGGSVANLLAVWRVHRVDAILRRAWEAGVVLSGVSAGSICWFQGGPTDSFGPELRPLTNALGMLPYGNGVHYDSDAGRRPLVHRLVADGTLPETHCTDDGVGLVYRGTELVETLTERVGKGAYVVTREGDTAVEERVEPRRLPESRR
ncbi:peptidase E [Streptomyces sp. E11-3]